MNFTSRITGTKFRKLILAHTFAYDIFTIHRTYFFSDLRCILPLAKIKKHQTPKILFVLLHLSKATK